MLGFNKKKEEDFFPDTNDILIVFDNDNKTSDIKRISEIREGTLFAGGKYAIPLEDTEITNSIEGRNFFYRAPTRSIIETQRLAALEKSLVLTQITQFKTPAPQSQFDLTKIMLFVTLLITIILGMTSCGG